MKRFVAIASLAIIALAPVLLVTDAWARAGGGSSGGSRGSRSYSSPARPSTSPATPSQPSSPPSSFQQPQPQRSGWGAGLMGGLAGLALGGLLGSMLFGHGMGGGLGGGIGFMEILLIAGGAFLLFRMMRNRRAAPEPAPAYGQGAGGGQWQSQPQPPAQMYQAQAVETGPSDLDRGVANIRGMDAGFDPVRFSEPASDIFFKVQAAWMNREMREASAVITPEMADILQKDCDRLRGQGRINRLDNIAVRSVTVTEAWQESGQDYLTVNFLASLLDYTVDERSGQVVEGNRTEPVKFEEFWTFMRPVGPNPWRLSAIQQA